jgi:serine/threonine protein kinase
MDTSADEDALVGTVIDGRYRLDEIIGRGGMGVVYRGEHISIRRKVAVKVLLPSLAGVPELRSRFEREAMAIGKIDHPNCVGVYDIGALSDGALYLVMEFLQGEQLGDVLQRERLLGVERAMHVLKHVLRGLDHIHSAGIVHRDIKLDNVMLVEVDGDPDFAKILDFGIAKTIGVENEDGVKLTQAGIAFGTPLYMAPEQALGNPLDGRADLYAASVMAFELLTGRPPFYSDDKIELLSMHTAREPPPMREMLPRGTTAGIPLAIEALVRRGLAKRPHERIQSAQEYLAEIDDALSTTSPVSRAESVGWTGAQPLVTLTGSSRIVEGSDIVNRSPEAIDLLPGVPRTGAVRGLAVDAPPKPPKLRSIWVYVAGLAIAGLLGVAIAVLTHDNEPPPAGGKLSEETAAGAAAKELERGKPAAAIRILEAVKDQIAADPLAQLVYGHALSATRANKKALAAYELALAMSPGLEADHALRANLEVMTEDKDPVAVAGAFELLLDRTKVEGVKERLLAAAVDPDMDRRWAVIPIIEKRDLGQTVDWMLVYGLDLEQGDTCERRKKAVARLRALGDARAIPALERALVKKTKGRKGKLVNQCLIDDATSALQYLRGLTGQSVELNPPPQ